MCVCVCLVAQLPELPLPVLEVRGRVHLLLIGEVNQVTNDHMSALIRKINAYMSARLLDSACAVRVNSGDSNVSV